MSLNSPCRMSPLRYSPVACRFQEMPLVVSLISLPMSLRSMSHVDLKKSPCRRVELKGQGPLTSIFATKLRFLRRYLQSPMICDASGSLKITDNFIASWRTLWYTMILKTLDMLNLNIHFPLEPLFYVLIFIKS